MNIAAILKDKASASGNSEAIIEYKHGSSAALTYAELHNSTCNIAKQLKQNGLKKSDVVLVATSMSSELYSVLLAIFQIGATAMFIDIAQGAKHLDTCLAVVQPQAMIASWKFCLASLLTERTRAIGLKFQINSALPGFLKLNPSDELASRKADFDLIETYCDIETVSPEHPALITFTSGSTGVPKAIVRSHGILLEQLRVLSTHTAAESHASAEDNATVEGGTASIGNAKPERELVTLPIFVLANLASGITSVIPNADLKRPGSLKPQPIFNQLDELRPSRITASPAFLDCLTTRARESNLNFPSVKEIFTGGGPVFPKTVDASMRVFPNAVIHTVYGSTEAEPISLVSSRQLTLEDRTKMLNGAGLLVGKPISEIEVRIVGDSTALDSLNGTQLTEESWHALTGNPKVAGEIVVSGAHVVSGYLNGTGDGETKVRVAGKVWHRTGDAGYLDSLGRLWLLGRHGHRIVNPDGPLYPFQVEAAAKAKAAVKTAALIQSGSKRILVVESRSPARASKLADNLRNQLSWAKLDEVRVVHHIPTDKRHNSKVVYDQLKRQLHIA